MKTLQDCYAMFEKPGLIYRTPCDDVSIIAEFKVLKDVKELTAVYTHIVQRHIDEASCYCCKHCAFSRQARVWLMCDKLHQRTLEPLECPHFQLRKTAQLEGYQRDLEKLAQIETWDDFFSWWCNETALYALDDSVYFNKKVLALEVDPQGAAEYIKFWRRRNAEHLQKAIKDATDHHNNVIEERKKQDELTQRHLQNLKELLEEVSD